MNKTDKNSNQTATAMRQLSRELVRELGLLEQNCCDTQLTPVQAHTLIEIKAGNASIKSLSDILKVDKSNASRSVNKLLQMGLVSQTPCPKDARSQILKLTQQGKDKLKRLNQTLNDQSLEILAQMTQHEQGMLEDALKRYVKSIRAAKQQQAFIIRPLTENDNLAIAQVIRTVSEEYGLSACKGYGVSDPNLEKFSEVYKEPHNQYWVIEHQGKVVGGGGAESLAGERGICELNKMYFLPVARGIGLSRKLAIQIIEFAKDQGYQKVYLETTNNLTEALYLYQSLGFTRLEKPLGNTGHGDCEIPMVLSL